MFVDMKPRNTCGKSVKQKGSSTNEANIMAETTFQSPIPKPLDTDPLKENHENLSQPRSEPKKEAGKGNPKQAEKKQDSLEKDLQEMQDMLEKLKIEKEKSKELLKEKDEMLKMKEWELEVKGKEQEEFQMKLNKFQKEQDSFQKDFQKTQGMLEKLKIEKERTDELLKEKDEMLKIKEEELEVKGKEQEKLQMELKKLKKKQDSFKNEMQDMLEMLKIEKEKTEELLREKDEMLKMKEEELKVKGKKLEELQMELKKLLKMEFKPNMTFPIVQSLTEQDKKENKKGCPVKKRPSPSYILLCKDQWNEVKKQNSEAEFKEIPNILGGKWKDVSLEEKKLYEEKYQAEKEAYPQVTAKEKCESEAMNLVKDLKQKTAMAFLQQYLQLKQGAKKKNKRTKEGKDRSKPKHAVSAFPLFSKQRRAAPQQRTRMFWRWQKNTKKECKNMTAEQRKASEEIAKKENESYSQEMEAYKQMKDEEALNLKQEKEELIKLQKQEALQLPKKKEKVENIIKKNRGKSREKKQEETEEALQLPKKKEKTDNIIKKSQGKRQKKKQRETDPNKPERPGSSFLLFSEEARKTLLEERPGTNSSTINALISLKWKELSKKEKKVWYVKASKAMKAYNDELEEYNKSVVAHG